MNHFEYQIIPADQWRRIKGNPSEGERPHLVPITPEGRTFAALDAFVRQTDLCPGEIRINGEWVVGYRFVVATETDTLIMLSDLNEQVEEVFALA